MPRKSSRRSTQSASLSRWLRKPLVQLGILAVVALIIAMIALSGARDGLPAEISVSRAHDLYASGEALFVDVREIEEWNEFHAPNTTHIPLGELAGRVSELPRDRQIVVVCRSGNRSQEGRDILLQAGFENVTSMAGGLREWQASGYPTVSGP